MKRISKVLVFLLMAVTFSLLCMPAEAALSGDYYSDSDAKEFYDSISFREIEPTENMGKIVSFDVANQILLAFSPQKIAVCDTSGKILKALNFRHMAIIMYSGAETTFRFTLCEVILY